MATVVKQVRIRGRDVSLRRTNRNVGELDIKLTLEVSDKKEYYVMPYALDRDASPTKLWPNLIVPNYV